VDSSSWIDVLERLERLAPAVVVPSRGPVGGAELLETRRSSLETLRATIWDDLTAGTMAETIVATRSAASSEALVHHLVEELSGVLPPRELLEDRGLRDGPSPTRSDPGWTQPRRVVWRNLWPERLASLQAVAPGVEIVPFTTEEEAVTAVAGADAVIGLLTEKVLTAGDELRWAQVPWAGVEDEVSIPGLAASGILLTNGQRLASPEIAEHAMALVRALARRLDRALELQSTTHWDRSGYRGDDDLLRLRGKSLLVVGLGGIGTEVARLAHGAGMTVLATRSSNRSGPEFVAEVGLAEDLDAMLERADVVVNCLPLTDETRGLFDRGRFRRVKQGALFVNVGRGGTVVTDDLIAALEAGELGGAGLDVTDPEPLPDDHPLWSTPGVVITPHSAAISDAGRERLWLLFRENLRRFAAGEPLLSVVDIERGY
jgi:phosphoglycerate dehydrogenase-like enzyme